MRISFTIAIVLFAACSNLMAQSDHAFTWREPANWWPISLILIALLVVLIYYYRKRNKQLLAEQQKNRQLEETGAAQYHHQLEMEKIINYFTHNIYNHSSREDLLWDITRNCISKMGFEDCVIYLVNAPKKVLTQKAAWGPKTTDENKIINPIALPLGTGIVGAVALSGRSEIINDTSKDPRYIVDDEHRYSELTVPIIQNGMVTGVIDCEHSKKNFYTTAHLQMMETIAALCADKLQKISDDEVLRQQEQHLATLNEKLASSQLTALRTQMNPHFIFNALNSVQQYILEGDVDKANRYLTKFSRLQREILQHCDQQFITVEKEIEMLQLYLQFEQLRFHASFEYHILLNPAFDASEIKIPPMLLQPFVENAIWHGLMPKNGHRKLLIQFNLISDDELQCMVDDNGIGITASARLNGAGRDGHVSKGVSLVKERLALLEQQYHQPFKVSMGELLTNEGAVTGTRISLQLFVGH